jgi:hypothetical protein
LGRTNEFSYSDDEPDLQLGDSHDVVVHDELVEVGELLERDCHIVAVDLSEHFQNLPVYLGGVVRQQRLEEAEAQVASQLVLVEPGDVLLVQRLDLFLVLEELEPVRELQLAADYLVVEHDLADELLLDLHVPVALQLPLIVATF